jgi:Icc-related predicted phosphoesterase
VKILLTADLHFHWPWFEWLLVESERFDLVCIAGDLLDMNRPEGLLPQMIQVYEWMQRLAKRPVAIAICSGNHDFPPQVPLVAPGVAIPKEKLPIAQAYARHQCWLQALKMQPTTLADRDTKIIRSKTGEALTVTALPYRADGRIEIGVTASNPWMVLHHEPPAQTKLAEPKTGSSQFALFVARVQPMWAVSGHVHFTPGYENLFYQRIGKTVAFNCRQAAPTAVLPDTPNYVVLDTRSRQATWHSARTTPVAVNV